MSNTLFNIKMKASLFIFTTFLALVLSPAEVFAFDLMVVGGGDTYNLTQVKKGWDATSVSYATVTGNNVLEVSSAQWTDAVTNSFQAWEDVANSYIELNYTGEITLNDVETFSTYYVYRYPESGSGPPTDAGTNFIVTAVANWDDMVGIPNAIGVTWSLADPDTRYIVAADIMINADPSLSPYWTIGASPDFVDLQSVITHEVGHFIGVGHPFDEGRQSSTMWWQSSYDTIGPRTLEIDDENAAIYLYPVDKSFVTTPDVVPPDNNLWGLRDTFTGEWTDTEPAIDPDNDPLVNKSGGGGGCSVARADTNHIGYCLPYIILLIIFSITRLTLPVKVAVLSDRGNHF